MAINLYLPNGYLDTQGIRASGYPYIFCTSARGIGKTYGELQAAMHDHNTLYVRYNQVQLDALCVPDGNPYLQINADTGSSAGFAKIDKYIAEFGEIEYDDKRRGTIQKRYGSAIALSVFHNIRSFGGAQFDRIFYDEFIPDRNARKIADEAGALFNLLESVTRSRELNGMPAPQLFAASNSNTIQNAVYVEFGLIPLYEKMEQHNAEYWANEKRGILLVRPRRSPVIDAKRGTALYKMVENTRFSRMALDNEFTGDDTQPVISRPLREYQHMTNIRCMGVRLLLYRHKSQHMYYVRDGGAGSVTFDDTAADHRRFLKMYPFLVLANDQKRIEYETVTAQTALKSLFP